MNWYHILLFIPLNRVKAIKVAITTGTLILIVADGISMNSRQVWLVSVKNT